MLFRSERNSLPPKGFDFGNTPAYASSIDLKGKQIIFTTSAGTQGIVNALNASEILIGSFANAHALVQYILKTSPPIVTLAAMGFESSEKAEEDEQCAAYLKNRLKGVEPNFNPIREKIMQSKGAERLIHIGRSDDLAFSLKTNLYPLVPIYDKGSGKISAVGV